MSVLEIFYILLVAGAAGGLTLWTWQSWLPLARKAVIGGAVLTVLFIAPFVFGDGFGFFTPLLASVAFATAIMMAAVAARP